MVPARVLALGADVLRHCCPVAKAVHCAGARGGAAGGFAAPHKCTANARCQYGPLGPCCCPPAAAPPPPEPHRRCPPEAVAPRRPPSLGAAAGRTGCPRRDTWGAAGVRAGEEGVHGPNACAAGGSLPAACRAARSRLHPDWGADCCTSRRRRRLPALRPAATPRGARRLVRGTVRRGTARHGAARHGADGAPHLCVVLWGVTSTPTAKQSRHRSKSWQSAHLMRTSLEMSLWQ
jgi:hypothetical protein